MRRTAIIIAAAGLLALPGCQTRQPRVAEWDDNARSQTNEWMLSTYFNNQVRNGVVRQHTLWSHHFIDNTAELNDRGRRDLALLSEHYLRHGGGVLNLPRNGTPHDLYQQRTQTVREALADAGVDTGTVVLDNETWTEHSRQSVRAAAEVTAPSSDQPYQFHQSDDK